MNKLLPMIAAALMLSVAAESKADKVIQIYSNDSSAAPVEIPLQTVTKVQFADGGKMNVVKSEGEEVFDIKNVSRISFGEASAIDEIEASEPLVVTPNPVRDYLTVKGGQDLYGSEMSIYSIAGMRVKSVPSWKGESVDVASIPSGIYILKIQSQTVKFMKL